MLLCLDQSLLVLHHDGFREEFGPVALAFCAENLVVLAELHFVVVDGLAQVFSH